MLRRTHRRLAATLGALAALTFSGSPAEAAPLDVPLPEPLPPDTGALPIEIPVDTGGVTAPATPTRAEFESPSRAAVPAAAPTRVRRAIAAANRIARRPYRWGGGHGAFQDSAYDCSGSVSYVLHGAGLLRQPLASGPLSSWGRRGRGRWITVAANPGHAYVILAGLRFDTAGGRGSRWHRASRPRTGFRLRHPGGY